MREEKKRRGREKEGEEGRDVGKLAGQDPNHYGGLEFMFCWDSPSRERGYADKTPPCLGKRQKKYIPSPPSLFGVRWLF